MAVELVGKRRLDPLVAGLLAAGAAWTLLVGGSGALLLRQAARHERVTAEAVALDSFNKDLVMRRWASGLGGVYAAVGPGLPPNPYLLGIPERDLATPSGRNLTLVNPAYMIRLIHELGARSFGLRGHITSTRPIRLENAPDAWEAAALVGFEAGAGSATELVESEEGPVLRFMRPLVTEESCLKCHAAQGYRVGDIRGGISVSVPFGEYRARTLAQARSVLASHSAFWGLGMAGLLFANRAARRSLARRERDRAELASSLAEKETLLRELYHRTKNSLQVIDSMLILQADRFRDSSQVAELVDVAGKRIRAMALAHEMLYRSGSLTRIGIGDYLRNLVERFIAGLGAEERVVREVEGSGSLVAIEQAVPLGLAVNELLMNSAKYAFPGESRGRVSIRAAVAADGLLVVEYGDDGPGLPPGLKPLEGDSLGLRLVDSLVRDQLHGEFSIGPGPGFNATLKLALAPPRAEG